MKILEKKSTLKISKTYRALGTVISLTIYGHQDEELLDKTYQLIKYYEQLFTVNRDQSELMAVNHKAGIEPVQVSGAVYAVFNYDGCRSWRARPRSSVSGQAGEG